MLELLGKRSSLKNLPIETYIQHHHTLLHNGRVTSPAATNPPPPAHQAPPSYLNDTITPIRFKLIKTFLQILSLPSQTVR